MLFGTTKSQNLGAEWNDEAVFSCVTEDGDRMQAQLTVLVPQKKPKVEKKKLVIKKVEFNEKASNDLVDSFFAPKPEVDADTMSDVGVKYIYIV